jgi:DNA-binding phage protein
MDVEQLLNAALKTNDLRSICRAVDVSVLHSGSIIEVARAAELDRVTLYRAFRLERGPALDNMIKDLRVLGFRLVVEVCSEASSHITGMPAEAGRRKRKQAAKVAHRPSKPGRWWRLAKFLKKCCIRKKTSRSSRAKLTGRVRHFIELSLRTPCLDSARF